MGIGDLVAAKVGKKKAVGLGNSRPWMSQEVSKRLGSMGYNLLRNGVY